MIFITDRSESKEDITKKFNFTNDFDVFHTTESYHGTMDPSVIIADIDMSSGPTVQIIKEKLQSVRAQDTELFFILREDTNREIQQAISLGANNYFFSNSSTEKIRAVTQRFKTRSARASQPGTGKSLKSVIGSIADTLEMVDQLVKSAAPIEQKAISDAATMLLRVSQNNSIESLLNYILNFHNATFRHSLLVSGLTAKLCLHAGCSRELSQIATEGALVHDIGKSLIPISILDKPGSLTPQERELIMNHPVFGYDYLKTRGALSDEILVVVRSHHELLDGTGYPDKLSGSEISRIIRIVTICDIYAALIEPRPYKKPHPPMLAFAMLRGMIGKLDEDLLTIFRDMVIEDKGTDARTS